MNNKQNMDTTSQREIKLLIDNSLLEQEKRLAKEFRTELEAQTMRLTAAIDKQNQLYSDQIISLNKDVTALEGMVTSLKSQLRGIKAQLVVTGTACATLGGLVGFFVAQLVH